LVSVPAVGLSSDVTHALLRNERGLHRTPSRALELDDEQAHRLRLLVIDVSE
jgi:hypothetical protein